MPVPTAPAPLKIFSSAKDALLRRLIRAQRVSRASSTTNLVAFEVGTASYHTADAQNTLVWQQNNTAVGAAFTAGNYQAGPARQAGNTQVETKANRKTTGAAGKRTAENPNPTTYTATGNPFPSHQIGEVDTTGHDSQFGGCRDGLYSTTDSHNKFSNFQGRNHNSTARSNKFGRFESGQSNTVVPNHRFNDSNSAGAKPMSYGSSSHGFAGGCYNTTGTGNQFTGYLSGSSTITGTYNTTLGNTSPGSAAV